MNHEEATQLMASERYLLGELAPDLREQFEEHFFECQECAFDLRAGNAFIAHTKSVLSAPVHATAVPAEHRAPTGRWLGWLRPAFAFPALAILLAVIGYQNLVSFPQLKKTVAAANSPQILASISLLSSNSRGSNLPSATVRPGEPLLLFIDVPPGSNFHSFVAQLLSSDGAPQWSLTIPAESIKDTLSIRIPPQPRPGTYTLVVRGAGGSSSEVARYRFELQFQN